MPVKRLDDMCANVLRCVSLGNPSLTRTSLFRFNTRAIPKIYITDFALENPERNGDFESIYKT